MQYEKIYNCKDDAEAAVILGMLNASGIRGISRDVEQGDILNVISGTTLYGKEICVPIEEADQARDLMKEYDGAESHDAKKDKPRVRVPYLILAIVFIAAVIFAIVQG